jgi:hypothetical protein
MQAELLQVSETDIIFPYLLSDPPGSEMFDSLLSTILKNGKD